MLREGEGWGWGGEKATRAKVPQEKTHRRDGLWRMFTSHPYTTLICLRPDSFTMGQGAGLLLSLHLQYCGQDGERRTAVLLKENRNLECGWYGKQMDDIQPGGLQEAIRKLTRISEERNTNL